MLSQAWEELSHTSEFYSPGCYCTGPPTHSNNNNNNRDDIYGAVIMAKPLREFTRFIWWMQTQRRGGRQPSDQANWLRLWVRQKEMAATVRIHYRHLLLLSPRADTHFTVPRRVEGWVDLGTAVRVYSPCPRLYIAVAVVVNNCPWWDSNLGPLTPQSGMLPLGHCDTDT